MLLCLFASLQSVFSTVLILFSVPSYFLTASYESLNIYLLKVNALFVPFLALGAVERSHSLMQLNHLLILGLPSLACNIQWWVCVHGTPHQPQEDSEDKVDPENMRILLL